MCVHNLRENLMSGKFQRGRFQSFGYAQLILRVSGSAFSYVDNAKTMDLPDGDALAFMRNYKLSMPQKGEVT
jgi:hypothetical protein